jgi:hypothetical protein
MPSAADILNDPDIAQAYEDVRSDKSETTWLILKVRTIAHQGIRGSTMETSGGIHR